MRLTQQRAASCLSYHYMVVAMLRDTLRGRRRSPWIHCQIDLELALDWPSRSRPRVEIVVGALLLKILETLPGGDGAKSEMFSGVGLCRSLSIPTKEGLAIFMG